MSFGYAVGDVIAVLNLLERIAIEIRNYRDAPHHFQELQAQLDIHKTTIQTVLSIEPRCVEDFAIIQRMRAIALHSGRPLQHFIDIMHGNETALGHFRTRSALRSIGTRLHWSMIAKRDVEELRAALLSNMLAINILLSTVQLYCCPASSSSFRDYVLILMSLQESSSKIGPGDYGLYEGSFLQTSCVFPGDCHSTRCREQNTDPHWGLEDLLQSKSDGDS